jgi:PRTRC genetic system ParB family protein
MQTLASMTFSKSPIFSTPLCGIIRRTIVQTTSTATSPISYAEAKGGYMPPGDDIDASIDCTQSEGLQSPVSLADGAMPTGAVLVPPQDPVSDDTPRVPIRNLRKGKNPRTYFDPVEMEDLKNSIAALGVLQAILVRHIGDGIYEIIAGERRYRAAKELFGDDYPMLVTITQLTDEQLNAAAAAENIHRASMSPVEEANAAGRELGLMKGDRAEAARRMGWSLSKLNSRLMLLNCSDTVQTALNERKIDLGHAELLAALAKDKQDKLINIVVKEKKPIAELKAAIQKMAANLKDAIFDKVDCAACPHNSTLQQQMFAEAITDGACTNSKCYEEKTEAALAQLADSMKDEYPVVRILRIGDNQTRVKLAVDGEQGVGAEQAEACKGCSNYGAAVSALPQAMGQVYGNQCFDRNCNTEKVAAWQAANAPQVVETASESPTAQSKPGSKAGSAAAPKAPPVSIHLSDRIKAYREKLWRGALMKEIANDPVASTNYLLGMCLNGNSRHIDRALLSKAMTTLAGNNYKATDVAQHVDAVAMLDDTQKKKMTTLLAASAMENIEVHDLVRIASHRQLDLRRHWTLDTALLQLLSKSEIDLLCKEIGLLEAFGDKYKKLLSEKKDDFIAALLKHESFDYSAKIPKIIAY